MVIATLTELTVMVPLSTNCHRDEVLMTNLISLLSLSPELARELSGVVILSEAKDLCIFFAFRRKPHRAT